jgi:GT2 family glycosyltransferase
MDNKKNNMASMKSGYAVARLRHIIGRFGREWVFLAFGPKGDDLINRIKLRYYLWRDPGIDAGNGDSVVSGAFPGSSESLQKIRGKDGDPGITVVIPVYNAYDAVQDCLKSVIRWTAVPYRLLIIDDASTDPRIRPLLMSFAANAAHVRVVLNDQNRGYTATINKGCKMAGRDDVVLLNSDTRVTEGWLAKMAACAKSNPRIATVTPLSNAAGVFSVPVRNRVNLIPDGMTIDDMGRLVEQLSPGLMPMVPTGNGFCMYVSRAALDAVGDFDAVTFPRGYGEENDFCMRASQKGFIHVIDDATFIYHQRSGSGSAVKTAVLPECMVRLHRMHPQYRIRVLQWLVDDPLDEFRRRLQSALGRYQRRKND